jgi:hypothetical protein
MAETKKEKEEDNESLIEIVFGVVLIVIVGVVIYLIVKVNSVKEEKIGGAAPEIKKVEEQAPPAA